MDTNMTATESEHIRHFCRGILENGDLQTKLSPIRFPPEVDKTASLVAEPVFIERPKRDPDIEMHAVSEKLPKLHQLNDPAARMTCLQRFAHHELMAVELFAWAILAYPEAPQALVRGFLQVLGEEQLHCRLYVARIRELGSVFGAEGLSDYFWRHIPAPEHEREGIPRFLAAMGLTLEQANLDFTKMYEEAFAAAKDHKTAHILARIHKDEIGHVQLAYRWLKKLSGPDDDMVQAYKDAVPFPLSAARAKARQFDAQSRQDAGMDSAFIDYIRGAKPYRK
jgi:uncharacterized ferritin-like protein (DUF455 family)